MLGAAILAAGLATSMAQNVYSLNVVGYYNIPVTAGYSLNACSLISPSGTNGINEVLANPPNNCYVLTFVNNDYNQDYSSSGAWFDGGTGNPSQTTLPPGKGWFFNTPTATNLTIVGTVPQGTLSIPLPHGYSLIGTYTPQSLGLYATNGFPFTDNAYYLAYDNIVAHDYVQAYVAGGAWFDSGSGNPETIAPALGQGYFINAPSAQTWNYNFTVQ
jgi:hypothetical protein